MLVEGRNTAGWLYLALLTSLAFGVTLSSAAPRLVGPSQLLVEHPPILIRGNAAFTASNGVIAGNGSVDDPYLIWGWSINATGSTAIHILDTTAHFAIRNVDAEGGIVLERVAHAHVDNSTLDGGSITVVASNNVVVRGDTLTNGSIVVTTAFAWVPPVNRASHGIVVDENTLSARQDVGVEVDLDNVTVSRNTISLARGGIYVTGGNASVVNNTIAETSGAIDLDHTHNTTLRGNLIHAFEQGVFALFPDNLTMVDNALSCGDHWLGCPSARSFYSINSTDLLAFHNRFLTVWETARDQGGVRDRWDAGYPSGGNYWVNYTGRDLCRGANQTDCSLGDRIGDTPYVLDGGAVVRYPLQLEPVSDIPAIETAPPPSLSQGLAFTFEARVSDSGGIHNVTLYYGYTPHSEDQVLLMVLGNDGVHRATIVPPSGASILAYYILATDEIDNTASFPTYTFSVEEQWVPVNNPLAILPVIVLLATVAAVAAAASILLRSRRPPPVIPPPPSRRS